MTEKAPELELRRATDQDIPALNELIMRSKAVWGYDPAFMEMCRDELALSPELLTTNSLMVAVRGDRPVGVAEVSIDGTNACLEKLFIEPGLMRSGAGRRLFAWARNLAADKGAKSMSIEADPDAEPFYLRMGARRVGLVPSGSIPGRMLPELELALN